MNLSSKEFEAICKLEPFDRYKYCIKKFADIEMVFSLVNAQNEFAIAEVNDKFLVSLWPSKEFALTLKTGNWLQYFELEISLESFNRKYLPQFQQKGYLLNIFPLFDKSGFVVDINEFVGDLNRELSKY
jgi:hypothetical protein